MLNYLMFYFVRRNFRVGVVSTIIHVRFKLMLNYTHTYRFKLYFLIYEASPSKICNIMNVISGLEPP